MDFAQGLSGLWQQSPERWVKLANRVLPGVAVGVLVLAIAYQLSSLTWTALSGPVLDDAIPVATPLSSNSTAAPGTGSYQVLRGWKPFGEPPDQSEAPAPVEIIDAPDTTLNLQLWGVNEVTEPGPGTADPEVSSAYISSGRAEQKLYYVGGTIDGANGATLHSVYHDRVLLNRGGRLETLRLPLDLAPAAPAPARQPLGATPLPQAQTPTSLRDVISNNAARFAEVVRIVPEMQGAQMSGFRLTPGRDREAFAALGLEPGDVLTEVNGMILNDPQTAAQVFTALGETSMANVTIMRNGSPQVLVIDMSQIESLTENQQ